MQSIYLVGGGLIIEANIPAQELEGQRGEGAYFWEDTVYTIMYNIKQNQMWPAFAHNIIHCFLDYLLCRQSLEVACLPKIHSDGVEEKSCNDMQGIITPFT